MGYFIPAHVGTGSGTFEVFPRVAGGPCSLLCITYIFYTNVLVRVYGPRTGFSSFPAFQLRAHMAPATYCTGATYRSKSLFKLASRPLCAQNHCSSLLQEPLGARKGCSSSASEPLGARKGCSSGASEPLGARNHCSSLLQSNFALKITVQACCEATLRSKSQFKITVQRSCAL